MNKNQGPEIPIVGLVPNIITFFGICVGLTALRTALHGNLTLALYLMIFAMVLDALDGKIARAMQSESKIGAELDSLADFFNFGIVTPLIVFYTVFQISDVANFGWLAVMTVAVCCAFRLARFNVAAAEKHPNDAADADFAGVPAPMLACLCLSPLFLVMLGVEVADRFAEATVIYLVVCGLLSIGSFPTFSIKSFTIPRRFQFFMILVLALALVCLAVFPWHTLLAANAAYLAAIPFYARFVHNRRRNKETD